MGPQSAGVPDGDEVGLHRAPADGRFGTVPVVSVGHRRVTYDTVS